MMRRILAGLCLTALAAGPASAQILDPNLPNYRPANDLKGHVSLIGSTTMTSVAGVWADSFTQLHPAVESEIHIRGSRGAVPAVMSGDATFGLLSRRINTAEVEQFEKQFGYKPKVITVCLERLGIYTHKQNPVRSLSIQQVAQILSGQAKTWGDVGAEGQYASQAIRVHGRRDETGSRVFLEGALLRGQQHVMAVEHDSNQALLDGVAADPLAIGYAGIIYADDTVKALSISRGEGSPAVAVDSLAAAQGQYPLVRPLQLVVNHKPGTELDPAAADFIRYVLSRSGQEDVIRGGFQAIPAQPAQIALDQIGLRAVR